MDPYEILGLQITASEDDIKERYKSLIDEYTKIQDEDMQDKINNLNLAYDLLINGNLYKEIRSLIENKNFIGAEAKLNITNDRASAEWNYLQGIIAVQKGWFESGLSYLRKAVEIDPTKSEYLDGLNTLQTRIIKYATQYKAQNIKPNSNNMNACGGNNNGGNGSNGGMC